MRKTAAPTSPPTPTAKFLAFDGHHVECFEDVLNEWSHDLDSLRFIRDRFVDHTGGDERITDDELRHHKLTLCRIVRHMEDLLASGHQLWFAQRQTPAASRS